MDDWAIEAEGLAKRFPNGVAAVDGASFRVARGSVFGFLGPNGAGKTTTVRMLNGTLRPTAGRCRILGTEGDSAAVRAATATVGEQTLMYGSLSVRANLRFFGAMYGLSRAEADRRSDRLLAVLRLEAKADERLSRLSSGQAKRAQLARVLLHSPDLLFLDEPTNGLDPEGAEEVADLIASLAKERGCAVFLCTHILSFAERICDSYGFIAGGKVVASGTAEALVGAAAEKKELAVETPEGELRLPYADDAEIPVLLRRLLDGGTLVLGARRVRPSLLDVYRAQVGGGKGL